MQQSYSRKRQRQMNPLYQNEDLTVRAPRLLRCARERPLHPPCACNVSPALLARARHHRRR
ncbi:hypothetical protein EON67_04465 [archaeon]|nr:MAG: hypothetical protein EON67_04465 [archaeon]